MQGTIRRVFRTLVARYRAIHRAARPLITLRYRASLRIWRRCTRVIHRQVPILRRGILRRQRYIRAICYRYARRTSRIITRVARTVMRVARTYWSKLAHSLTTYWSDRDIYAQSLRSRYLLDLPHWQITPRTSHAHRATINYMFILMTVVGGLLLGYGIYAYRDTLRHIAPTITRAVTIPTPTLTLTPTPDPLTSMSPAERIGQLFVVRVPGAQMSEETREYLQTLQPGGIILMRDNITDIETTRQYVTDIVASTDLTPLIAVDQEGGTVLRLPWDSHPEPGGDHSEALAAIGASVNLAPVLDLQTPDGYIRDRAYATDSASVTRVARSMITAQSARGIVSVGKHFPGIGRAVDDPHARIPQITASRSEMEEDLAPFIALSRELDMIMSSHVRYSSLDSAPSTLSRPIMTDLLRSQIGYEGVTITDDLNMDSIVGERDKYVRALVSGHDMLLTLEPAMQVKIAYDEVAQATLSGRLRMSLIDERVKRILLMKAKHGLLSK